MKIKIKGICKNLFLTGKNIALMNIIGSIRKFPYDDIHKIDYFLDKPRGSGFLEFTLQTGKKYRYEFWGKKNDDILNALNIVKEKNPDVQFIEHFSSELKIYQQLWFQFLLCLFCCSPVGIILMWYHKTANIIVRIELTILFTILPCLSIYLSYINYKQAVDDLQQVYNSTYESVYDSISNSADIFTEETTYSDNLDSSKETEETQTEYSVGDVFESEEIKIMFIDAGDYPVENPYAQPTSGNKYIFVELSVYNMGETDLSIGSVAFDCYADNSICKQPIISTDDDMITITTLSPGRNTKGKIFYEVPKDAQTIEIEYETDFWDQDKIYFIVK